MDTDRKVVDLAQKASEDAPVFYNYRINILMLNHHFQSHDFLIKE